MSTVLNVMDDETLVAIIVRAEHKAHGVEFQTSSESEQQLGLMGHPKGKIIQPHFHPAIQRTISTTPETLFIKSGKLRVDFYRADKSILCSHILGPLDLIMIFGGGHGFEVLEELQMIEVKQGPFVGESSKVRFSTQGAPA